MAIAELRVEALPEHELTRLRDRGMDDFGNPLNPMVVTDAAGAPLRCCLREASVGERIALIAYQPSRLGGPYAEVGPVFIHADPCAGYAEVDRYPHGFRNRQQLLRAYSTDGRILDAAIAKNGDEAETTIRTFFQRRDIAYIHSRNVLYGCYMFTIRRPA